VRRYPKEIRQLCERGRNLETINPTQIRPDKLVIQIDGKPLEVDWPSEGRKRPPSNEPPPK